MTPDTIGNYRLVRQLGAGGMGAVYEAVDTRVDRKVAIKMLRKELAHEPELVERFRAEAATLARLNHPSTATLLDFVREGDDYYMVMEFVPGRTLEQILADSGRLPPQTAMSILCQTLDGMEHARSMGVLHRDIKPANIMVTADGRAKVTDFGIARILGSSASPAPALSPAPWNTSLRSASCGEKPIFAPISTRPAWSCSKPSPAACLSSGIPRTRS